VSFARLQELLKCMMVPVVLQFYQDHAPSEETTEQPKRVKRKYTKRAKDTPPQKKPKSQHTTAHVQKTDTTILPAAPILRTIAEHITLDSEDDVKTIE
jgi:hypothetical protein